jgi:hypothetical protein
VQDQTRGGSTEFRSARFVMSTGTELVALLVLRTRRPFRRSRPGRAPLDLTVAYVAADELVMRWRPEPD